MARTRWPPGPVNPGLWHRPGRSDRQRRWVPKTGARPIARSQDNPNGVGRFGGQTGPGTDPAPTPPQNAGSRAGALTHTLPADSAPTADGEVAIAEPRRTAASGAASWAYLRSLAAQGLLAPAVAPRRGRVNDAPLAVRRRRRASEEKFRPRCLGLWVGLSEGWYRLA